MSELKHGDRIVVVKHARSDHVGFTGEIIYDNLVAGKRMLNVLLDNDRIICCWESNVRLVDNCGCDKPISESELLEVLSHG